MEFAAPRDGTIIARIEDFGYAAYPCAINAKTGNHFRKPPCYLRDILENEHSPVRTYFNTIEPKKKVYIKIVVEVVE